MRKSVYLLILFCFFSQSCSLVKKKEIEQIKREYSEETLNYLYEVAFHDCEYPKRDKNLWKWGKDIGFYIDGDTLPGDRQRVLNAINQISTLKLPIKIHEKAKRDSANLLFLFTTYKQPGVFGSTKTDIVNNFIDSVKISISYDPNDSLTFGIRRQATILHEMMHALGLTGHSYKYSNCVLILNFTNYTTVLTDLDKHVIDLLYDPVFPAGYTCKQFEQDFANVLYHISTGEKVSLLIKEGKIKKESLEYIYKFGLIKSKNPAEEECMVKFTLPVVVRVKGDYSSDFADQIKKTINEINNTTDKLSFIYAQGEALLPDAGVYYTFRKDSSLEYSIESKVQNTTYFDLRFPYIIKSEIQITFKNAQKMQMAIANSLYSSVILQSDTTDFFLFEKDDLHLKPFYKEVLKAYYNPFLTPSITKSELAKILNRSTPISKN